MDLSGNKCDETEYTTRGTNLESIAPVQFESDKKGITEPSAPRLAAILPNLNSRTLGKSRIQTRIVSISSLITASSKVGSSLARVDEDKFDDEITEEEKREKRIVEEDRSCREGEGRHVQLIQF